MKTYLFQKKRLTLDQLMLTQMKPLSKDRSTPNRTFRHCQIHNHIFLEKNNKCEEVNAEAQDTKQCSRKLLQIGRCSILRDAPDWEMLEIVRCSKQGDTPDWEMPDFGRCSISGDARNKELIEIGRCSRQADAQDRGLHQIGRCSTLGDTPDWEIFEIGRCLKLTVLEMKAKQGDD